MVRKTVDLGDRKVTVVGTAHVSDESVQEVRDTVEDLEPDFVGVELDENRLESLRDREGWKSIDIKEAVRDGKGSVLALNLLMSIYQRKIGMEQGVEPGSELLEAVEAAEENGIEFDVIDQDISVTLNRVKEELSILDKILLLSSLVFERTDIEVEELKESDMLSQIVSELEEEFPELKKVLLDERNEYMADRLLEKDFEHAVVFVGAAHVEGLIEKLEEEKIERDEVEKSSGLPWLKAVRFGVPIAVIAMLGYAFLGIDFATGTQATMIWILANGFAAMLGAIVARAHLATWLVSFVSAPLTSLYPALGAGMVAGYFEAKFYPPSVGELEDIVYIEKYSDLWGNQVGRIILTFVLVSIGSAVATFAGAGYIASVIAGA
jgi:pheromone shutdown-related protein TraB